MPGDLHRAGRFGVSLLAVAGGCSRAVPTARDAAPPDAVSVVATPRSFDEAGAGPSAATLLVQGFARDGEAATDRLASACDDRGAYLELRRAATASLSAWRRWAVPSADAAFGPQVAIQESGGSIGALDRAMQSHDCDGVRNAAYNIGGAFRIAEYMRADMPPPAVAQALSDAAYRLGQAVLESTSFVPEGDDATMADVLGLLDFLDAGTRALGLDVSADAAPLARLREAHTLAEVTDRASIVRATGVLGASIRRTLRSEGLATTLTYRTLRDAPDISALTLPRPAAPADPVRAAIGRRLFLDRRLSRGGSRACATCHVPSRAYSDGLVAPASLDPSVHLRRNTPSLLYAPLEAVLTWDGRVRTADRQALMVLHTRAEMGASDEDMVRAVASDASYAESFVEAFPKAGGVTPANIALALAAYEASALVPGTAAIDRFARGDDAALSRDARAGLDVFAGKGRCARCHVPPLFGGSRPPDFTAPVFAVLGVPSAPGSRSVDQDPGAGSGTFRVPTVRNVGRTAPYFHNGRYPTLEQVVDFYDRGGGNADDEASGASASSGVNHHAPRVPNQDPEVRPLHLSAEEKRVLLVFMRRALEDAPLEGEGEPGVGK